VDPVGLGLRISTRTEVHGGSHGVHASGIFTGS
jgi:hypothetical protein